MYFPLLTIYTEIIFASASKLPLKRLDKQFFLYENSSSVDSFS